MTAKKGEETKAEKPVTSQNKADDTREEAAPAVTEKAGAAKKDADGAPYPSQADLDAIKEGTFLNRQAKSDSDAAGYKTR